MSSKKKKNKKSVAPPPVEKERGGKKGGASFATEVGARLRDPWIWIIFGVALAVRIIYLVSILDVPFFDAPVIDAEMYDDRAMNMLGGTTPDKIFYQAPLYSVFLAIIYSIFGHNFLAVRIIQFIIGAFSCVLVYLVGRKAFNLWCGRIAGLIAALYGPMIHYDGEMLRPVLVIFLSLFMLWAILEWLEKRTPGWAALAGVLLGLSAITRENILLFGLAAAVLMFIHAREKIILAPVVFLFAAGLMILPVTIRNYIVEDDFVPVSPQGGMNFFIGNSEESERLTALQPGIDWDKMSFSPREDLGMDAKPSQYSSWFFKKTFSYIASHPGQWLKKMWDKFWLFWAGEELTPNTDLDYYRNHSPILKILMFRLGVFWVPFGIIAPLFFAGVLLSRKMNEPCQVLFYYVIFYMLSVVLFHVRARYRLPVAPVMLPFAVYAVQRAVNAVQTDKIKTLAAPAGVFLFLLVAFNFTWVDTSFARGYPTEYFIAKAYVKKGDDTKALEYFEQAEKNWPKYAELVHDYGQALMRLGRKDAGIKKIEHARDLAPDNAFIRKNLGQIYRKEADALEEQASMLENTDFDGVKNREEVAERLIKMAVVEYEKAEKADPFDISIKYDLALLYDRAGRKEEFRRKLWEYIELAENRPGEQEWVRISKNLLATESQSGPDGQNGQGAPEENLTPAQMAARHVDSAQFYLRGKNYARAEEELNKARELDPSSANVHALLGNLYKKTGRDNLAEQLFVRAIELDPDNLLAHNNLANIYRDSGRFELAGKHYDRALELAPDNPVVRKNRNQMLEMMNR